MKIIYLAAFLLATTLSLSAQSAIHYVSATASGANDGTSWTDAFTNLSTALAAAQPGDQVWVAEGTYRPSQTDDRSESFVLPSGVQLFGGFAGTEQSTDARDWVAHPTILSGDIGAAGDSTDNSFNILYLVNPDSGTVIDGFTFFGGVANSDSLVALFSRTRAGGAMYIMAEDGQAYCDVRNCTFEHNYAYGFGGAVYVNGRGSGSVAPRFSNCTFRYNHARFDGGGLYRYGGSIVERSPDLGGCSFYRNRAGRNGAGFCYQETERSDTLELRNCLFIENQAISKGGAASITLGRLSGSHLIIDSCAFERNRGQDVSAVSLTSTSLLPTASLTIRHCRWIQNGTTTSGPVLNADLLPLTVLFPNQYSTSIFSDNVIEGNWCRQFMMALTLNTISIHDCMVRGNTALAILHTTGRATIDKCHFIENRNVSEYGLSYVVLNNPGKISNCVFRDNRTVNNKLFMTISINPADLTYDTVYNCLFFSNKIGGTLSLVARRLFMQNCAFYDQSHAEAPFKGYFNVKLEACYFDTLNCAALSNVECGAGLIIGGDPLLRDTAAGDFRPQVCSPLVNAGFNTGVSPSSHDLAGANRIERGTVDIGPFELPPPVLAGDPSAMPACAGATNGSATFELLDACLPLTYTWTAAGTAGTGNQALPPGLLTFTIADAKGGLLTVPITIPQGSSLQALPSSQPVLCGDTLGGSAAAAMSGGPAPYTFSWSDGSSDSLHTGLPVGQYWLTVTDALGCTATATVNVGQVPGLSLAIETGAISCPGAADGSLTVLPVNGQAPYEWHWEDGTFAPTLTPLGPGDYGGTLTDAYGCQISWILPLTEPDSLNFSATIQHASGPATPDGALLLGVITGGTAPYLVVWSNGFTGNPNLGLLPGAYAVSVTDAQGCVRTQTFLVEFSSAVAGWSAAEAAVWPNPVDRQLSVRIPERNAGGAALLRLFSASGQEVARHAWSGTIARWTLPTLPAGSYGYLLTLDGNLVKAGSLVKAGD